MCYPEATSQHINVSRTILLWLAGVLALFAGTGCSTTKLQTVPEPILLTGNIHNRCLAILKEGLHSDEFWPMIHASEALVDAQYAFEAIPVLKRHLAEERDLRYRAGLARALVRAGERNALTELQDILLTTNTEARVIAIEAMFRVADVADVTIVTAAMDSIHDGRIRIYAAAALALARGQNTLGVIREGLASDSPAMRYVGADVITVLGNRRDDLPVLLLNRDRTASEFEGFYTLRALAFFGDASARQELAGLLRHTDPTIRSRAVYAAAETWLVQESDYLLTLLDDPSLAVRVRAAQALLILSNPTSPFRYLRNR